MSSNHQFVLVHGAGHGAWCWYKLVAALNAAGRKAIAIDLATCGINPKQVEDLSSFDDYFESLITFMNELPSDEKVILVAHSAGGVAISVAMEKFPTKVSASVFVTAAMPGVGTHTPQSVSFDKMDNRFKFDDGPSNPPTALLFGPCFLSTYLYQLSPAEDLSLATLLTRWIPYSLKGSIELTRENYGSVYRVFIVSLEDALATADKQRMFIELNPPNEVKEISGSDHMVMFSKPQQLCDHLLSINL